MEGTSTTSTEALIPRFKLEKILNQDWGGRRLSLLGTIDGQSSLLLVERAALPSTLAAVSALHSAFTQVSNIGANDIYAWYLASIKANADLADLKITLIYPCTRVHITKYSIQNARVVTESPEMFKKYVRPYMVRKQQEGRLNWVYNIIDGHAEQEDVILRSSRDLGKDEEGFLLLPDMNWDRKTMSNLRILGLVERRDILSIRDLKKKHISWLKAMYAKILNAVADKYEGIDTDMLKVYCHYQPTYYHMHLHIVSVALEANSTQAVGKAFSLLNIISQLEGMAGDEESGMQNVDITYTLGEMSELWIEVFSPLKNGTLSVRGE